MRMMVLIGLREGRRRHVDWLSINKKPGPPSQKFRRRLRRGDA
jgi:hypothetical protein